MHHMISPSAGRSVDTSQAEKSAGKIGATHLGGMGRVGLKELSQIVAAFPESVQPVEEPGLAGNALPQEIYQARHENQMDVNKNVELQL